MLSLFREQPRAFSIIFMLEIWERFGFYTVQGILTLYFIRVLGFSDTEAYYLFGAFSALLYGMVALGGYLGDSILGTKRTIVLGLVILSAGYLALALVNKEGIFFALALVCVGNGIFKANPSNLLAKCYEDNDHRLHGGFTLYYMAINLGSTVALFLGPSLASHFGYSVAYFSSFIGLVIGLTSYWFQCHLIADINNFADRKKVSLDLWAGIIAFLLIITLASAYLLQEVLLARALVWVITAIVTGIYLYYMTHENKISAKRMFVSLILMLEAIVFFTLYQQMPTSINLFAVNQVSPYLLGIPIDPQSFQALNPLWIIIMSPILAALYKSLYQSNYELLIPYKFALGMFCCALSFLVLFFARYFHNEFGVVSSWWLILSYFFQSTGELLVSALGVAMVAELVPKSITGFVMGMWFLTSSISSFIGATVASYTALPLHLQPGIKTLNIYTGVFAYIGLVTLGIGLLMWFISPVLCRFISTRS